jgi:hypothetical protein
LTGAVSSGRGVVCATTVRLTTFAKTPAVKAPDTTTAKKTTMNAERLA